MLCAVDLQDQRRICLSIRIPRIHIDDDRDGDIVPDTLIAKNIFSALSLI